ncbi:Ribosomal protein L25/L23 [Caldalkalibacillus thermarum TA2.A1]|uniref:Large ribosomal subunit protein uL23 n=1 Tax=Caldalkalibacillus thermarum (strain TA2.A1) TaxID=986075 RepID=F5L9M6_CALTT|nr:50S ribosomal protein L23 [Caldalkalibacillus thermarum]EGL82013.1 Ribosomal protein L25/L23 [Caldalkalibacillus thermarum TA2.A1]QZT34422.1 50S ribosomal protein L23 [Caldalkalibacillus thermarum TA2.A1]GGK21342.1 50S ribosomal protein L23 [Caldalkalibacillus thermarum]
MKDPRDIIKRPIITERSTDLMEQKKYVFEVDVKANKTEIKKAVEQIFDVKVVKVNTINMKKKPKRFGRFSGFTPRRKKAIVQLSEDSKPLEFFEGA